MYGTGLNSIRWRFALASAVLTALGVSLRELLLDHGVGEHPADWPSLGLLVLGISGITFWMASRLTGLIGRLQRSTEAVAEGSFDSPISVDCECEVGGLADSFRRMTERMNANLLRMNTLAYTDRITGLPNRSAIDHLLRYALAPERAGQFKAAIVFIGLDGFRHVNDMLGHAGGDDLLRQAANRILTQGLRRTADNLDSCIDALGNPCNRLPEDKVFARFAGDEFVAVLPGQTDRAVLAQVAERLRAALREPFVVQGRELTIGASIGIATTPDDTCSAAELLSFADLAMHRSKQAGQTAQLFFDQASRDELVTRAQTEAELRLALQRGELRLYYQPQLNTHHLGIIGVEALVRWQHPRRGLLAPAHFIDLAERAGLMAELGRQVLAIAAAQCRAWLDEGVRRAIAVNASPSEFNNPGFVDGVLATLREAGVPPELISIEITESMAMEHFEATASKLHALREAGVRVAIDDFGNGFSNLSLLARLPMDELKIDRSLISEIGSNPKSEAIIRAVFGMTRALGCQMIAEGIETPLQLAFLQDLGCDSVQGYLLGRPMPPARLRHWRAGGSTEPASPVGAEAPAEAVEAQAMAAPLPQPVVLA